MSKSAISKWVELFSNECQKKVNADPTALNDADLMKENLRLRKELEEARKENLFLKKQRHSLQRRSVNGVSVY